ncbi:MAG: alpha/beta-hydrolase family protein [Nakamurella sp.]
MVTSNEAVVADDMENTAPSGDSTSPTDGSGDQSRDKTAGKVGRRRFRYTLPGCWVAVVFLCLAFTPSLVPRPGVFQGVVCGLTGAIGYGLGVGGAWVWRQFADREPRVPKALTWRIFGIVAVVALVTFYLLGQRWQGQIRTLVEAEPEDLGSRLILPVVAALVFVGLVAAGRGIRNGYRWAARRLSRWMGARAARALGWVLAAVLTVGLVSGVLVDGVLAITDRAFAVKDTTTSDSVVQPSTPLRSGGPGSLIGWDTLGYQGRNFAGSGPTTAQISAFSGTAAMEPIRAYAGINSADTAQDRARLAVADLQRAGGFDRANLLIAGTTGTGWVDPAAMGAFEYETGGDSATVAIQYSYLPSWASFLVDQDKAREAGRALFDEVYRVWSSLPADQRPKIYGFGLSLGSFMMETPFGGDVDMANRTDGILLAGSPAFNELNREFTNGRDAGSPEVQPIYQDGRIVRFSNNPADPIQPAGQPWDGTRVLYLQNASDPIVWLSPDLILHRPDWLTEPAGPDVIDEMRWIPFVTFWQVTMDMLEPVDTPSGHGHTYTVEFVDGWAHILQPPGWTSEMADNLRTLIAQQQE